jgi:hypothetical protein
MGTGSPSADPTLASDAERAAAVERLTAACAEGRLTLGEFGDRSAVAHAARTRGELEPLVADLPDAGVGQRALAPWTASHMPGSDALVDDPGVGDETALDASPRKMDAREPAKPASERHFSILGLVARRGRWKVKPRTIVTALIGGAEIDLSQALISEYDVTLKVRSIIGRVEIVVPKGVRVEVKASSPIGGRDINLDDVAPEWPVIRLSAYSFVGGVEVKSK